MDSLSGTSAERIPVSAFLKSGMIVIDTNVLLDLYRITPAARNDVLGALSQVSPRLWVPHQVAVEYRRNRAEVMYGRARTFSEQRKSLSTAQEKAIAEVMNAVGQFVAFRQRIRPPGRWDQAAVGLEEKNVRSRIAELLEPARAELKVLNDHFDMTHGDVDADPILTRLDELLYGRIGPPLPAKELRKRVEEALKFRYPNQIPPGYLDAGKSPPIVAAGDYIIWRQVLTEARKSAGMYGGLVMIVTGDAKQDWWDIDERKGTAAARQELVDEMREIASATLVLASVRDFLRAARDDLALPVLDDTITELREVDVESLLPDTTRDSRTISRLEDLSPVELERLVEYVFVKLGNVVLVRDARDLGVDLVLKSPDGARIGVEVKMQLRRDRVDGMLFQLQRALTGGLDRFMLVTTEDRPYIIDYVRSQGVSVVDGPALTAMLDQCGITVQP